MTGCQLSSCPYLCCFNGIFMFLAKKMAFSCFPSQATTFYGAHPSCRPASNLIPHGSGLANSPIKHAGTCCCVKSRLCGCLFVWGGFRREGYATITVQPTFPSSYLCTIVTTSHRRIRLLFQMVEHITMMPTPGV